MPLIRNVNGKDWQYATNQGKDFDEGGGVYKQQEWGKNCVMFALSKVLGESTGALAKDIVDNHRGGVQNIKEMENSPTIKAVLNSYDFKPVIEGGAKWQTLRNMIKSHAPRRLYATYWRNKNKEDWSNKDVQPGKSDHAFAIFAYGECMLLPVTNDTGFDGGHPTDDEYVSAWLPPNGRGVEEDRRFTVVNDNKFRLIPY